MNLTITLNNKDIKTFGLTSLEGTLNALMKPAPMKALVFNENIMIDGSSALLENRKIQKRDILLPFIIAGSSLADLAIKIDSLTRELISKKENILYVKELNRTYRLVYVGFDKYSNFYDSPKASIIIKFTELNPALR